MYKSFVLLLLLAFANILNAQYRVEEISISGELTADDPYEPKFGRFDAVELYLNKGDVISINLTAEFPPFIALVAPSEKYYVEYTQDGGTITNYLKTITESGTWFLSIAADSADFGKYDFVANYMSANSITLPANSDYCTTLKFLSEHSKTNFFFLKKSAKGGDEILWEPKINLSESIESVISENENSKSIFKALMFESENKENAETFLNDLNNRTENCLGTNWVSNKRTFVTKDKQYKKSVKLVLEENNSNSSKHSVWMKIFSDK